MRAILYFTISLIVTLCSYSLPVVLSQIPFNKNIGVFNVPIKSISIVADLPWSTPGVEEPISWVSLSMDTEFKMPVRQAPYLVKTANGKLWFLVRNTLLTQEGNSWRIVDIKSAKIDRLISIAPLDDLVIMLGRNDNENVLAAVDTEGKLLWRRTGCYDNKKIDLVNLLGDFNDLLIDIDGKIYLPGTRIYGAIAHINPTTGTTSLVLDFGEYNGDNVYIRNSELFYILAIDGMRYWVRHPIGTNQEIKVRGSEEMQDTFSDVKGILPDGGVLLWQEEKQGSSLTWMSPKGETIKKIILAGIARYGHDVFAAIPVDGKMLVKYFSTKDNNQNDVFDPLPDQARLVRADLTKYDWIVPTSTFGLMRIVHIDRKTKERSETLVAGKDILDLDTKVDMRDLIIVDPNTLLLTCVDSQGAFVVRVEFADK
jgi:hypothetical protein